MKRIPVAAITAFLGVAACSDSPVAPPSPDLDFTLGFAGVARVTNDHATGPGSFHHAIATANANAAIQRVEFARRLGTIELTTPIVYTGTQDLTIDGNHATLEASGLPSDASALPSNRTAGFRAEGGGDLEVRALTLRGAPGPGLVVSVPSDAAGTITIKLLSLTVTANQSHGVLINDQAGYVDDPGSTNQGGSAASLAVHVLGGVYAGNGFPDVDLEEDGLDQDGLRINEGGAGSLQAVISGARVLGNGGDGVELDERAAGDVHVAVFGASLDGNGSYSELDLDDGMDIDESGDGHILGSYTLTSASNNFEQGLDLNENDAGDIRVDMTLVRAIGNLQEGIEYEEDDDVAGGGDIVARLAAITTRHTGTPDADPDDQPDAGLKLREKGEGNLDVQLSAIESSDNLVTGVQLREDAGGNLTGSIRFATTSRNGGDGIEFDENSAGNLDGLVQHVTSSDNVDAGVRADQAGAGTGTLQLVHVTAVGNGEGVFVANAGVTVTQTP